jgi:hypothetical protein
LISGPLEEPAGFTGNAQSVGWRTFFPGERTTLIGILSVNLLYRGATMSAEPMEVDKPQEEDTGSEDVSYTQVACSAIGNYTSPMMRQSLRIKLEREREERRQRCKASVVGSFRKLFG